MYRKAFVNELGNKIRLWVSTTREVHIRLSGPTSATTHRITFMEAEEMYKALAVALGKPVDQTCE